MTAVHAALVALMLPHDVPIDLGRDEAAQLAREELAKPIYASEGEPWISRLFSWLIGKVSQLLDVAAGTSPLGWFGLLGVAVLVVLVVVAVRRRTGALSRDPVDDLLHDARGRTAADLRREADRYAADGAWAEAVRARLRAVVRDLEDRGLVDAQPGRTADEVARAAGQALPSASGDLRAGARIFDEIWYGGRVADSTSYARLVAVDDAVAAARPGAGRPDPMLAVPR